MTLYYCSIRETASPYSLSRLLLYGVILMSFVNALHSQLHTVGYNYDECNLQNGFYRCPDNFGHCISASAVCNRVYDCWNGADEHNCATIGNANSANVYAADSLASAYSDYCQRQGLLYCPARANAYQQPCVATQYACSGFNACSFAPAQLAWTCGFSSFGNTLSWSQNRVTNNFNSPHLPFVKNRYAELPSTTAVPLGIRCADDEFSCKATYFGYSVVTECINGTEKCNGLKQCQNGYEEPEQLECDSVSAAAASTSTPITCNLLLEIQCDDHECIPRDAYCRGQKHCSDNSDKRSSCSTTRRPRLTTVSGDGGGNLRAIETKQKFTPLFKHKHRRRHLRRHLLHSMSRAP